MSRQIEITVSGDVGDALCDRLHALDGVVGLQRRRQGSVQPPGDVITVVALNRALPAVMHVLDDLGIGQRSSLTWTMSEPVAVVSHDHVDRLARDVSECVWEEMETVIAKESNVSANALLVMAIAGAIAAAGIATDALHVVVGAMVIAPGFEPIARIGLGIAAGGPAWKRGVADTLLAYLALGAGALAMVALLSLFAPSSAYLPGGTLASYWSSITPAGLLVSGAAGVAGMLLIASNRSVLTAGVMIALALVPAFALAAMALYARDTALAAAALLRWTLDVALVLAASLVVFGWKRWRTHRRRLTL